MPHRHDTPHTRDMDGHMDGWAWEWMALVPVLLTAILALGIYVAVLLIAGLQLTLFAMWFDMEANKDLR